MLGFLTKEILNNNDIVDVYSYNQLNNNCKVNGDIYTHDCGTQIYISTAKANRWEICPVCNRQINQLIYL